MAIKHNNSIHSNHFRKDWQRRVRCHFDQPGKKASRREARRAKAAAVAPRPVDRLRPIVRCPTIKYNRKVRAGRGFTLGELKAAAIPRRLAPTIGIAVDHRRQNLSEESFVRNVERLKAYKGRVVVFPKKGKKPAVPEDAAFNVAAAFQFAATGAGFSEIKKSELPKQDGSVYTKLRDARANQRYQGAREKRAKEKAEEAANKKG